MSRGKSLDRDALTRRDARPTGWPEHGCLCGCIVPTICLSRVEREALRRADRQVCARVAGRVKPHQPYACCPLPRWRSTVSHEEL